MRINPERIGFMQGRLSPQINGKIQCFPWDHWKEEFVLADQAHFRLMEWTLDYENLYQNPLMTEAGRAQILELQKKYQLRIPSLTGDCFMQEPLYKSSISRNQLEQDFENILKSSHAVGIRYVVMPLVDNGALENSSQEDDLVQFLLGHRNFLISQNMKVIFESDFRPPQLKDFLDRLPKDSFGLNYDMGNSASLGFDPDEEFALYGDRIENIHIKDRVLGGTTVPLGEGNCAFDKVFRNLHRIGYSGNFILQTARAKNEKHLEILLQYRNFSLAKSAAALSH